jgi:excisionase family DNA binding protein
MSPFARPADGPATTAIPGQLFTIKQVSELLQLSSRTIYSLTAAGDLPAVRIGRSVRYRPADLAAYVERLAQGGAT